MKHLILVAMALCLAACGGGGSSTPATASSSSSSSVVSSSSSSESSGESSSSSSSSDPVTGVQPLPVGSGLFSTRMTHGETYRINEETGEIEMLPHPLPAHYCCADVAPNGVVIAATKNSTLEVHEIDFLEGESEVLFTATEELSALAVAADGTIVAIGSEEPFGNLTVYRYTREGEPITPAMPTDIKPGGIDFMPDGRLIATTPGAFYVLDPVTGETEIVGTFGGVPPVPEISGDIDIDSSGMLRVFQGGNRLEVYDIDNGTKPIEMVLQHDYFHLTPVVYR